VINAIKKPDGMQTYQADLTSFGIVAYRKAQATYTELCLPDIPQIVFQFRPYTKYPVLEIFLVHMCDNVF